jgi:hypothetical protein
MMKLLFSLTFLSEVSNIVDIFMTVELGDNLYLFMQQC